MIEPDRRTGTGTATSGSTVGGHVAARRLVDAGQAAPPSWSRRDLHGMQGSHAMRGDRS